ncbi:MAG: LytTR family transcriptional regulator DNA-binding domain-containing protein [Chitinophagaceae bacterium]|nr:LytTR family transcriptional regulator DNA-binding domain-containing protein [Chitinophagaceae bacterium]
MPHFFRCHKSYIVNTLSIVQYVKSDKDYLMLTNGLTASISPEKVDSFIELMR